MLDIGQLSVSLTKHGAHKIALLLAKYDKDSILDKLSNVEPGINIEEVQARKNLSVGPDGRVPEVWNKARAAGSESINALVLIGVIFSHYSLIGAMQAAKTTRLSGSVERASVLNGKAFTNFAHTLEELGYTVSHTKDRVTFSLARLFEIPGLNVLASELLSIKLKAAGWDGKSPLADVMIASGLHEVFSLPPDQFKNWLTYGDIDAVGDGLEDESFFTDGDADAGQKKKFHFTSGHTPKKTGFVPIVPKSKLGRAELLHNELQTKLYAALAKEHGAKNVGTEIDTGHGTSIDLAVKVGGSHWFYEIKVAKSVKACIRQAIPQLLEYAYWRTDSDVADRLYIASKFELTDDAAEFLELLRTRFQLPLYYAQITD